ncbi:MAG: ATPase, T2SS/T4P/T4SS family [Humidesulfovibrio sp.]|nr:ATPase, T2SS/T4P/T4SS family [Humidesulfovibrio sp.]
METFTKIINACHERGFSDLHITGGHPLVCRRDGEVCFQKQHVLAPQYVDALVETILNPRQKRQLKEQWSTDLALTVSGKRMRLNVFSSHRGVSLAIRFLPSVVPDLDSLNLHPSLRDFCGLKSGLLVICGSTGSGKTTTIAALINEINNSRACHVVTLEDPIEYLFASKQAFIEQRELGKHFHSYQHGLLDVLRQAPDVIVVGEMRAAETIQLSLDAAESGHLVITTMHAGSHEEAVHRMCNLTKSLSNEHTRLQLSHSLAGIINQQLLYMPRLRHSVPLLSVLRNTKAIATLIRENKLSQLDGYLESCKDKGMFTFTGYRDDYLFTRKEFHTPVKQAVATLSGAPEEYSSRIFNYDASAALRENSLPAVNSSDCVPGLPAPGGDFPEGLASGDIESYISQLESRSV